MKFYSDKTKELYETAEALTDAEKAFDEAAAEKENLKAKRAERAKEVEDAFQAARVAQKAADEMLEKFLKDYGSFHTTIKQPFLNIFDDIFDRFFI